MCRGEGFNSSALVLQKEGAGIRGKWDMETTLMTQVRVFHSRTDAAGEGKWDASGPSRTIFCSLSCPAQPLCQCWAALSWVEAVGCPQPSLSAAAGAVTAMVLSGPTWQGWLAEEVFTVSSFLPAEPCHQHHRICQGNLTSQQSPA